MPSNSLTHVNGGRGRAQLADPAAHFLQTCKALTDGCVPPQEAQAAIGNPSLMRALAAKYLGPSR
jgi:hypothetical protein